MKLLRKTKGFTIIELMIVIGIIGILAAIGIPSYNAQLQKGRASEAKGDLLNLAANVEVFKQGNFTYTGATSALFNYTSSPKGAAVPHFNLSVDVLNAGRDYMVRANANQASSESKDDGTYWYNPKGRNWYIDAPTHAYSAT